MIYVADSIDEVYPRLLSDALYDEDRRYVTRSKNRVIYELPNAAIVLRKPANSLLRNETRRLSFRYAAGELAFYLAQSDSLEFIAHYASFWRGISDDGKRVNSCYGKRLFKETAKGQTQMGYVKRLLQERKETRKAVAMIYKERDTNPTTKDNPCTMYLHFAIRNDKLLATTHMRSNDLWLGTPYDVFFFTTLQRMLCAELQETYPGLEVGEYTHIANSLHLYDKNREKAEKLVAKWDRDNFPSSATPPIGPEDLKVVNDFLMEEELMRVAPDAIPCYTAEHKNSPFFSLMSRFLEGRDA